MSDFTRIAVVDTDKCKPNKCNQECKVKCPSNAVGKKCVEVMKNSPFATISEPLCVGCGICAKVCPFQAIKIINVPKSLESDCVHRYGYNSFKLHRLPMPRPGEVLGIVGSNGIGKSTALKIMAGKLMPNLGICGSRTPYPPSSSSSSSSSANIERAGGSGGSMPPSWKEVLLHYRGTSLQPFFSKLVEGSMKALVKPQYVDSISKTIKGTVREILVAKNERGNLAELIEKLGLENILDKQIEILSGGETQSFCIAAVAGQYANVYLFDEASSFLDIRQRLRAANVIRGLTTTEIPPTETKSSSPPATRTNYVMAVEHDLCLLDYMSDSVAILFGVPGAYGVVSAPSGCREGINQFLSGFITKENLRFRDTELSFKIPLPEGMEDTSQSSQSLTEKKTRPKVSIEISKDDDVEQLVKATEKIKMKKLDKESKEKKEDDDIEKLVKATEKIKMKKLGKESKEKKDGKESKENEGKEEKKIDTHDHFVPYSSMKKTFDGFSLEIERGQFRDSQIVVLLAENGMGKTTFINLLSGITKPDGVDYKGIGAISMKPQKITPKFTGTVLELLHLKIPSAYINSQFIADVIKPLGVDELMDCKVQTLSGGQLQVVAITLCLGKPANVYFLDEPSSYLDSEARLNMAKVIKRFIFHSRKTAFVVEHDFMVASYLADQVIVFSGTPGVECKAHRPQNPVVGMNSFLKRMEITFRRDEESHRPRINKLNSVKDIEQKKSGTYFYVD